MSLAQAMKKRALKAQRRALRGDCPQKTYRGNVNPNFEPAVPRALMYARVKQEVTNSVYKEHAMKGKQNDLYVGWPEGMRRRNARRIIHRLSRRTFRNLREQMKQSKEVSQGE